MITLKAAQIAYKSEWALAKFFASLKNSEIQNKLKLIGICGREETKKDAWLAIKEAILKRTEMLAENPSWRSSNREIEIDSLISLLEKLQFNGIKYYHANKNQTLPQKVHENADAIIIHSKNTTHLGYIEDAIKNLKHVLCEKPLVSTIDERGKPYPNHLNELEKIIREANPSLILMDAEHYSYKKASTIFYENLEQILKGKNGKMEKIKEIEGHLEEKDDPNFSRTRDLLSLDNRTSLLDDTMCHLLAFISNLGGTPIPKYREYDIFKGYDVDTFNNVEYKIKDCQKYFTNNAFAYLRVAKFIDKQKKPKKQESKNIKFTLEDDSEILVDFKKGSVTKKTKDNTKKEYTFRYVISNNEYTNILNHFYEAIINQKSPLTDFRNSLVTLKAIYQSRTLPSNQNKQVKIYN